MKRVFSLFIALLLLLSFMLFSGCEAKEEEGDKTEDTTQNTYQPTEARYDVDIETVSWARCLVGENTYENGEFIRFSWFSTESPFDWWDVEDRLHPAMRSATYTPTEFPPDCEFCEVMIMIFYRYGDSPLEYRVHYVYEYATSKLLCTYDGKWYEVTDYEGLLCDLISLSNSYDYQKFSSAHLGCPCDEYFIGFSYERFFSRKTGWDPSIYSGFVYTDPLEEVTEEKIIERAEKEAEQIDTSLEYMWSTSDPYTGYWLVEYEGDLYFTSVYLDECGRTVQITTNPVVKFN